MQTLLIGDPHVTISNIQESKKLFDFILKQKADNIVILGDLFHNHAVVRLEIQNFWSKYFNELCKTFKKVFVLVGNHDMILGSGIYSGLHSLQVYKDLNKKNLFIIDKPIEIDGYGFIPYLSLNEDYIEKANNMLSEYIFSHQSIATDKLLQAPMFKNAVPLKQLQNKTIISGHIHKAMNLKEQTSSCFYTGSPKWETLDDANQDKGIYILDAEANTINFISTKEICTAIVKIIINEGEEIPDIDPKNTNYLVLQGSSSWIKTTKKKLKGHANIIAKPNDKKADNKKLSLSIEDYLNNIYLKNKEIDYNLVLKLLEEQNDFKI